MSGTEPTVALVFSPEAWVEAFHRHVSHHGGARVRQIVVEPATALDEDYDVLVVSDRWPALTLAFVEALHRRGRRVLGVFDPEEPAGKDHLLRLGADATAPADAAPPELVVVLSGLTPSSPPQAAEPVRVEVEAAVAGRGTLVVVSGPRGSGVTEVALGLAAAFVDRGRTTLLVDAHEAAPALAGRLGLALEPNLRSAVDACVHGLGSFSDSVVTAPGRGGALHAVTGFPSAIAAAPVSTDDVLTVLDQARRDHDVVVVDVEERSATGRAVMSVADALVGVVGASPVGVVRAMEWASDVLGRGAPDPHVVVNRAPGSRFRQDEIRAELGRAVPTVSITWCPHDAAVDSAAWDGAVVGRGGFRAACVRLAGAVDPIGRSRSAHRWRRPR